LLPPELYYAYGIDLEVAKEQMKWTPVDTLASIALVNFSLTWGWSMEYIREINLSSGEALANLAE